MKRRLLAALILSPIALWGHPMGNASVSHYSRIEPTPSGAQITYLLDFAEVPSIEVLKAWERGAEAQQALVARWARGLEVERGGRAVQPAVTGFSSVVSNGCIRVRMALTVEGGEGSLHFRDANYSDRPGWKEIVVGAGTPDRSRELSVYPPDAAAVAPQDLETTVPGPGAPAAPGNDYLARLLHQGDLGWGMMLAGLGVAFGLGAVHALSPGHGKTIVAAYLVGTRGTPKHAIFLGGMVTFTHTISVFFLGFTTLFLSRYVLPEKIYPVLGTVSGLSIVWIGATLFYKRLRAAGGHRPPQPHHHAGGLVHDHGDGHYHSHVPDGDVSMGSLIALGASGGLVPCPSALVLLLSSVALGRVALGLTLLVAFSAGLAVVLMAIGLIVLYAKHLLPDREKTARSPLFRYVPVASAAIITCAGILMTGVALGVIRPFAGV